MSAFESSTDAVFLGIFFETDKQEILKYFFLFLAKKTIYFRDENGGSLLVWHEFTCVAALRCRVSYELGSVATARELDLYIEMVLVLGFYTEWWSRSSKRERAEATRSLET